jgi:low temperature requirement protein LtrA
MELFFDLIFVAAVAEVGVPLTTDYSLSGLSRREIPYTMNT